jgi:hypothetical protein
LLGILIFQIAKNSSVLTEAQIECRVLVPTVTGSINFVISIRVGEGQLSTCQNVPASSLAADFVEHEMQLPRLEYTYYTPHSGQLEQFPLS